VTAGSNPLAAETRAEGHTPGAPPVFSFESYGRLALQWADRGRRIDALSSALEPFAREYSDAGVDHLPDEALLRDVDEFNDLTIGDLRRARRVLDDGES